MKWKDENNKGAHHLKLLKKEKENELSQIWWFENSNKLDKSLALPIKKIRKKANISKIRNEEDDLTVGTDVKL